MGGWGVRGLQAQLTEKNTLITFLRHQPFTILQRGPIIYFKENYNLLRFQRGSIIFQGRGVQIFPGGVGSKC